jgi:hypothetical protein
MSGVVSTLVVNFGEDVTGASGSIVAEWDDEMTLESNGEPKTQFVPGDERYLLVHTDSSVTVVAVKSTSGAIASVGGVVLDRTAEIGFGDSNDEQSLNYLPAGPLSFRWFGNAGSGPEIVDKVLRMLGGQFPCLAAVSVPVAFTRYRLQTPIVQLAKEETWPIRVYIYFLQEKP